MFIVLKLCKIEMKVNVRVTKIVLKSIVKASSGLIITVNRNMILSIIYLPIELHSSYLSCSRRLTMVLEKALVGSHYFHCTPDSSCCNMYWWTLWGQESSMRRFTHTCGKYYHLLVLLWLSFLWVCIIISPFSLAFGVVDLVVLLDFQLLFLVLV